MTEETKTSMISFGAGINSVAMTIALVKNGWRGPIVFADTGNEWPETYCYIEYFEHQFLAKHNLKVTRLSPATHPELYKDKRIGKGKSLTLEQFCLARSIIPLLAVRWCSVEFKQNPLQHWRKAHGYNITIIGFSASEPQRVRDDPTWRYPLIEHDITRSECGRIIQRTGLELPIKSGCFFCPGQRIGEWKRLHFDHPDLYERAIALEDKVSAHRQKQATLIKGNTSLRQHRKQRWAGQTEMDLSQWLPCICRL